MSLELVREFIKVSRIVGQDVAQTIVENDIIVPDVKPDIANILVLDGDVTVNNTEVMQDKLLVSGIIRYKILYVSDSPEQPVKGINTAVNFSSALDIQNAKHGMNSRAKCDIEHIDYEIKNGRKINVKTIVSVYGKVTEESDQDIPNDLRGSDDVQVLKENVSINSYIGDNEVNCNLKETLQVPAGKPAITEILRNDIKVMGSEMRITDDKVIVSGELSVTTLYIGDDAERSIQYLENEIPFTHAVEVDNISESASCHVEYRIIDSQFDEGEDSDGEIRVINSDINLAIYVSAYESRNVEVLADAYCTKAKLGIEKSQVRMEKHVNEGKGQATVKDSVVIEEGKPEMAQVFNVLCKPVLAGYTIAEDKIVVEGLVNNKVIYLSANNNQQLVCNEQEIPFKHTVDMKDITDQMQCDIGLNVDHCNYSMISGSEVEVRNVISVEVKVITQAAIPVITKVVEAPLDDRKILNAPSITIYFAQPEDTLWKIAKKYYTTVDEIARVNGITGQDEVAVGQQVIIPRHIA